MLDSVYNAKILEYAGNIERIGKLDDGSTVTVWLKMEGETVSDFAHEVKACALGQAAASIMAQVVVGSTAGELRNLREAMYDMLKQGGAPKDRRFEAFKFLEPVREYKARHASTLLTFDAVVDCIDQIEACRHAAQ